MMTYLVPPYRASIQPTKDKALCSIALQVYISVGFTMITVFFLLHLLYGAVLLAARLLSFLTSPHRVSKHEAHRDEQSTV